MVQVHPPQPNVQYAGIEPRFRLLFLIKKLSIFPNLNFFENCEMKNESLEVNTPQLLGAKSTTLVVCSQMITTVSIQFGTVFLNIKATTRCLSHLIAGAIIYTKE